MSNSVLAKKEKPESLPQLGQQNPIATMLQAMIDHGVTTETAAAMEKLTDLYLRVEAENAKKAFAIARNELHADLPKVIAKRTIPSKDGSVRSTFAAYEDIKAAVDPYLAKHGFSVSFSTRLDNSGGKDRICAICKLTHIGGHFETNEFAVRTTKPPETSDAQADGATLSYAKRCVFCLMLDIQIDHDTDARLEGDYIKPEQAESLKSRVKATGSDEAKFLKLAGAESYEKIRANKYAMIDFLLSKKEAEQKQQAKSKKSNKEGSQGNENPIA